MRRKQSLLEIYGTRAMILGDSGRSDEALAAYEQAREFGEELFRARPEDPRTSHELARTLGNRGNFLAALGRRADALASYERALEGAQGGGGRNPTIFLFPAASAWIDFAASQRAGRSRTRRGGARGASASSDRTRDPGESEPRRRPEPRPVARGQLPNLRHPPPRRSDAARRSSRLSGLGIKH